MKKTLLIATAVTLACTRQADINPALNAIDAGDLLTKIKVLASDEFEGRAPATKGEDLTLKYLTEQLQQMGLKPGNPNGTYLQNVPLVGIQSDPAITMNIKGTPLKLTSKVDFVASSRRFVPAIKIDNSEVVFVGYGVVAPEYGWDDYKGVDVKGKTILMLVNDPAVPDPNDP